MEQEIISGREFSRRMGVSEKSIRDAIKIGKISDGIKMVDGKPKIIFEIAKREFAENNIGGQTKYRAGEESDVQPTNYESSDEPVAGLDGTATLAQATRAEKIFKAQKACLEVEELQGTLVRKEEVYRQLYQFGNVIKSSLQAIPDRITDELISLSSDRDAFYRLLSESIDEELLKLSEFKENE